jgi:hypothetical protein
MILAKVICWMIAWVMRAWMGFVLLHLKSSWNWWPKFAGWTLVAGT